MRASNKQAACINGMLNLKCDFEALEKRFAPLDSVEDSKHLQTYDLSKCRLRPSKALEFKTFRAELSLARSYPARNLLYVCSRRCQGCSQVVAPQGSYRCDHVARLGEDVW